MENVTQRSSLSDHLLNTANSYELQNSSRNSLQKPIALQNAKWRQFLQVASTYWLFEFFFWTFALACFLAIVGVLFAFDGQLVPAWHWGITLNALVSLLASLATFALMVPVTACLGQLKWLWFRGTRRLTDFELIESAGRGPSGSIRLLLSGRGGLLAFAGAVLTILMLAIGPFVQQIVNSNTRPVSSSGASVPVARWYNASANQVDVDLPMKAAIMSGMLTTNDSSRQYVIPSQCPTGNCTWQSYQSLAVCSSCADLTKSLTSTRQKNDTGVLIWQLPNGLSLETPDWELGVTMTVNNTQQTNPINDSSYASLAFTNFSFPPLDVFVILGNYTGEVAAGNDNTKGGPYASECILDFCVQNYTASSSNGTFIETASSEPLFMDARSSPCNDVNPGSSAPNGGCSVQQNGLNYTVDYDSIKSFWFYLNDVFAGTVDQVDSLGPQPEWPSDLTQSIFTHLNATPHTLDAMFDNIARSMTLAMRTQSGPNVQIGGQYFVEQTFVKVEWGWIALPLALLVFVLVFLIAVAVVTRRQGLEPWKESSIPTLFHGLGGRTGGEELESLMSQEGMDDAAKEIHARLSIDGERLYLQRVR